MDKQNGRIKRKSRGFTQVSNKILMDPDVSLKAKGLYSMINALLDIPNFTLYKSYLVSRCKEGRDGFNSGWKELKDRGYLIQKKIQNPNSYDDAGNRVGGYTYEYQLVDDPDDNNKNQSSIDGFSVPGTSTYGNSTPGKAVSINNTLYNNTNLNNTNKLIDDVIYKIQNASAIQQLRILEAGYYSEEIQEHIQATNELILRTCQVLSEDKLIKLAKFNDPEKVWKIAYDLTTKEIHASNQDGYFITSINNMLKQGGQE